MTTTAYGTADTTRVTAAHMALATIALEKPDDCESLAVLIVNAVAAREAHRAFLDLMRGRRWDNETVATAGILRAADVDANIAIGRLITDMIEDVL